MILFEIIAVIVLLIIWFKERNMASERKNIMVFIAPGILETWGGLKELCKAKGYTYNTLKAKKYPICIGGEGHIYKVPFKKHCIDLENQAWGEKKRKTQTH